MTKTITSLYGLFKSRICLVATAAMLSLPLTSEASHGTNPVSDIDYTGMGSRSGSYTHSTTDHVWVVFNANAGDVISISLSTGFQHHYWIYRANTGCVQVGNSTTNGCLTSVTSGGNGATSGNYSFTVPTTGQYAFQLDSYIGQSGSYTMSLSGSTATTTLCNAGAPTFTACPSNITTTTASNSCVANVSYTATSSATITYSMTGATVRSGSGTGTGSFNKGTTNVTLTATACGASSTCNFTVTVNDATQPSITAPANVTVNAAAGTCGANPNIGNANASDNCSGVTISNNRPATFPVGTTTVTWTATDASNNTKTATQTVTVLDKEAPSISGMPSNIVVGNDAGTCGAVVSWTAPTASDNCSGATISGGSSNGTTFPIGTTTVSYTATDASNNSTTQSFTVTVNDTENPTIVNMPSNITVGNDAGACGAIVSWTAPTAADNCSGASISGGTSNGTLFPLGTTTVTYTATDAANNSVSQSFTVTVNDTENPTIVNMPSNITVSNDAGVCGAVVSWTAPTAADNCSGSSISGGTSNGTLFPIGTTTVSYTATDAANNSYTNSFTVTVNDTENPTIVNLPANITVSNDAGVCGAVVNWTAPTAADNCSGASISGGSSNGTVFPIGTTTVIYTATDASNNSVSESFTVTVNDAENPTIVNMPSNITVSNDAGVCGAVVSWTAPTAADNCSGSSISGGSSNGTLFPVGTTTVSYTATDAANNSYTSSFTVTVNDTEAPSVTAPANITMNGYCNPIAVTLGSAATSDNCGVASLSNNAPATFGVGTTTVTYTVTDVNGNSSTATQTVTVNPSILNSTLAVSPVQTVTGQSNYTIFTGYGPQSVTLTAAGANGTTPYTYSWSTGATTASVSVSPTATTTYTVTITDAHGCQQILSRTIYVVNAACGTNENNPKVLVCHNNNVICISSSAVPAHLAHGCKLGNCTSGNKMSEEDNTVEELATEELHDIHVYPNPANSMVTVEVPAGGASVMVMSVTGAVVTKQTITGDQTKVQLDLANQARGIYLIKVVQADNVYQSRLILQ